jgi:MoxR-like ATPase
MSDLPLTDRRPPGAPGPALAPVEVDREGGRVLVLQVEVPLRGETGPLVPRPERFAHFTLDRRTAEVLEKLATAVRLAQPCLLEGETSTSKTSSIEYLAMLTGSPVARLNLSGQTDTAELIGKYVPNDGSLRPGFDALLSDPAALGPESQAVLERARRQGRALSLAESQRIASSEGLAIPAWRWQDGAVPEAMVEGRWLVLDEINLAEAQVLERLNPVLERHPSLLLSEGGGQRIGPGGERTVHPGFRVFATMNPAETSGRSPLSPAYKDRFTAYKHVATPSAEEYAAMLVLLVFGEQPRFRWHDGAVYGGQKVAPLYPELARVSGLRGLLEKLARLHAELEAAARRREIGRESKERLAFTRRTLLELCAYLERVDVVDRSSGQTLRFADAPKEIVLRALRYFYLDRVAREDDLQKVQDLLDAVGLSERQWKHDLSATPPPRETIVPNLGGGSILLSGRREAGGYRAGQKLRVREELKERLPPLLRNAASLEVIGVSADGKVVVRIDGGVCFKDAPPKIAERFEPAG